MFWALLPLRSSIKGLTATSLCWVSLVLKCANAQRGLQRRPELGLNVPQRVRVLALAAKSQLRSAIIESFGLQSSVNARLALKGIECVADETRKCPEFTDMLLIWTQIVAG